MSSVDRTTRKYAVLGMHGADVKTVADNVARVRMLIHGESVDEDFPIPAPISMEQQLDEAIRKRIAELEKGRVNG